jgi:prepilin-type N-terminal cleavage/methylation domain-containing protein
MKLSGLNKVMSGHVTGILSRMRRASLSSGKVGQIGFSLIEVLLAVSIMSVIVFGLFSMFNQTQKALLATSKQVDILGSGRAAIEVLVEDIQKAEAPGLPVFSLESISAQRPHMQGTIDRAYNYRPVVQKLVDNYTVRTNLLQSVFFLTRSNLNWVAKGYFFSPTTNFVANPNTQSLGFGTLFRFSSVNVDLTVNDIEQRYQPNRKMNEQLLRNFWEHYEFVQNISPLDATNRVFNLSVSPLVEGVVHFNLQPIDSDGRHMRYYNEFSDVANQVINRDYPNTILEREEINNEPLTSQTRYRFYGDALPAFMELEIGVLDPEVLARVKAMPNPQAARQFLQDRPEAVHLFRRMIPLSTANRISLETQ